MTNKSPPTASDIAAALARMGRGPKSDEQRRAEAERKKSVAAVKGLPIEQWPPFEPKWDLSRDAQKYVLDSGKDEFDDYYPEGLVLRWIKLTEFDVKLTRNNLRAAHEVWDVGDPSKAAGVLADWIDGRALTPPGVDCFEKRELTLFGGNHRLAVARARGVPSLPILIDPRVLSHVEALVPLSDMQPSDEPPTTS